MNHICTAESLRAGCEDIPPFECPFCGHKTALVGWTNAYCTTCMAQLTMGESPGHTVMSVREGMKMTRREIADHAGLKPSTIKKYEWVWPSRKYLEWLKKFTHRHYEAEQEDKP